MQERAASSLALSFWLRPFRTTLPFSSFRLPGSGLGEASERQIGLSWQHACTLAVHYRAQSNLCHTNKIFQRAMLKISSAMVDDDETVVFPRRIWHARGYNDDKSSLLHRQCSTNWHNCACEIDPILATKLRSSRFVDHQVIKDSMAFVCLPYYVTDIICQIQHGDKREPWSRCGGRCGCRGSCRRPSEQRHPWTHRTSLGPNLAACR